MKSKIEWSIDFWLYCNKSSQLHAVSRIKQGRQWELSVKTVGSPHSSQFFEALHCSGGTQRQGFTLMPEGRKYILLLLFSQVRSKSQPSRYNHMLVPLRHDGNDDVINCSALRCVPVKHWFPTSAPQKLKYGPRTILILLLGIVRGCFCLIVTVNFYYIYLHA